MQPRLTAATILLLTIGLTRAQSAVSTTVDTPRLTPAATPTLPPCVFECLVQATRSSGCTTGDKTCACTNLLFQQASRSCMEFQCNPNEQAIAVTFQQKQCSGASSSGLATPTTMHLMSVATSNVAVAGRRNIAWVGAAGFFGLVVAL